MVATSVSIIYLAILFYWILYTFFVSKYSQLNWLTLLTDRQTDRRFVWFFSSFLFVCLRLVALCWHTRSRSFGINIYWTESVTHNQIAATELIADFFFYLFATRRCQPLCRWIFFLFFFVLQHNSFALLFNNSIFSVEFTNVIEMIKSTREHFYAYTNTFVRLSFSLSVSLHADTHTHRHTRLTSVRRMNDESEKRNK